MLNESGPDFRPITPKKKATQNFLAIMLLLLPAFAMTLIGCSTSPPSDKDGRDLTTNEPITHGAVLGASEILVGQDRLSFGIMTSDGTAIEGAEIQALFYYLKDGGVSEFKGEFAAHFQEVNFPTPHPHTNGQLHVHHETVGIYVISDPPVTIPGIWVMDLEITQSPQVPAISTNLAFEAVTKSATLIVGDQVPAIENPTISTSESLQAITSHQSPTRELYELTIADALQASTPFIVLFASPAFCTTRLCGPMTDLIIQMHERFNNRFNFIHIEPWDLDLARTKGQLKWTRSAKQWGLPSEPWLFVINDDGVVATRFEGLVGTDELITVLESFLESQ